MKTVEAKYSCGEHIVFDDDVYLVAHVEMFGVGGANYGWANCRLVLEHLLSRTQRSVEMNAGSDLAIAPAPRIVTFMFRRGQTDLVFQDPETFEEFVATLENSRSLAPGERLCAIVIGNRVKGFVV
jgi:translation elongation factor P/translation initiation factor 5A